MAACPAPLPDAAHGLPSPSLCLLQLAGLTEASQHMENVVKFVFQACSHDWEPHAACADTYQPRVTRGGQGVINGSGGCLLCVHGVKVPNTPGSLHVVARAPPGVLGDMIQLAAQEKQGWREPPSSRHQREVQHGSVVLNNYVLIQLFFHNVRPCSSRDHAGAPLSTCSSFPWREPS